MKKALLALLLAVVFPVLTYAYSEQTQSCIDRVYGYVLRSFPSYDSSDVALKSSLDSKMAEFCLAYTPSNYSTVDSYSGLTALGKDEWDFLETYSANLIYRKAITEDYMSSKSVPATLKDILKQTISRNTEEKDLIQSTLSEDSYISSSDSFVFKVSTVINSQCSSYNSYFQKQIDALNQDYTCDNTTCRLTSSISTQQITPQTTQQTQQNSVDVFPDVSSTNSFYDAIKYLKDNGIVGGYDDGTYRPFNEINRAEFTKIIVGSITSIPSGANCFPDVSNEWFAPYVCYAKENHIIDGYEDGTFKPNQNINLAEALKIVLLALKVNLSTQNGTNWYDVYVNTANESGLLVNINNDISHNLSRGEMAQLIYLINK